MPRHNGHHPGGCRSESCGPPFLLAVPTANRYRPGRAGANCYRSDPIDFLCHWFKHRKSSKAQRKYLFPINRKCMRISATHTFASLSKKQA